MFKKYCIFLLCVLNLGALHLLFATPMSQLDGAKGQVELQDSKKLESKNMQNSQDGKNINLDFIAPVQVEITKINDNLVEFDNNGLKVGEYGVVQRSLGDYEMLIASAVVVKINNNKALARIAPFSLIHQPYLPDANLNVKKNDKIIFRSFNNKAFLIAPNVESYDIVKKSFNDIEFLNSDLLLSFLNQKGKYEPSAKLLKNICAEYGAGLVFIAGSKNLGIFDCQSYVKLQNVKLSDISPMFSNYKTAVSPFYARVRTDGGGSFLYLFSSKKSRDNYFNYYDEVLDSYKNWQ